MIRIWIRALRVHQYAKNTLVFVPLAAAHLLTQEAVSAALAAFLAFSLCASAAYIINDLIDLEADRAHPTKRERPFANGDLSTRAGMMAAPLLLLAAGGLAWLISLQFAGVLAGYFVLTTAYSLFLKRKMLVDVVVLSILYNVRIFGGAVAADVPLSHWLLTFALFMFTALALVKRYVELKVRLAQSLPDSSNRNYKVLDLDAIAALAAACSMNAVNVFALYISSLEVRQLYTRPNLLWLICPILIYWLARAILMAHRGFMHDDPIVFAFTDWNSWAAVILILLFIIAAA